MLCINFFFLLLLHYSCGEFDERPFPDGFVFGVASASYQIEGAWDEDGKSENIWDRGTHDHPELISEGSNGDVACDSYHKYKEDVQLIKELGVNFYRFSISWSRVIPDAVDGSKVNTKGVEYYNNLINELLVNDIEPYVTIFHWDTPQSLEDQGGWLNETIIDNYVYYAKKLFFLYGDRVKKWITFNEPEQICNAGYETGDKAPFMKHIGVGTYKCYHNVVRAHGKVYRMYEKEFKADQKGEVGITIDTAYATPKTNSLSDQEAAERFLQFNYGLYAYPIMLGNYPTVIRETVDANSEKEGLTASRLPKFTEDEIEMISGSSDFLGLNHYTTKLATFENLDDFPNPSFQRDCGVGTSTDPSWTGSASSWLFEVPAGFHQILVWIKEHYNNPRVLITENGWSTGYPELDDTDRVHYIKSYLSALLKAIHDDGCNVIGYTYWSILDNFEWRDGYTSRFGITYVDFNDANRTRTPRTSYKEYQQIISKRKIIE